MKPANTILVVDDQLSARDTIEGLLLPEGYNLTFAASGEEALARLDELKPDTILLDVMMPHMNGFEVCRHLKAGERWRHIPVILVTALADKEYLAHGLEAGADDFLSKPVNSLELRARVRSMLRIKDQFDRLEANLQLREDMANMIVHDLRTPLTPILGLCELMLLANNLSLQQQKDIGTIRSQARQINSYLNDMLILAKLEQEQLILHRSEVEVNQLVLAVEASHRVIATACGLRLTTHLPPDPFYVMLDETLFKRLLDNLVSNAVKFSPPDGAVAIKVEQLAPMNLAEQTPRLRLQVTDEGPGIPKEYRDEIFDKFSIVDLKKTGVSQIGLGLAFCKMVAKAHGGRIFVEDNLPRGSVFTVEI